MDENTTTIQETTVDNDTLLPDGWDGESDIFAWAEQKEKSEGASLEQLFADDTQEDSDGEAPTTGDEVSGESETEATEDLPTSQEAEPKSTKLRFEATIDHRKKPIEIDESELPSLYQKAQVSDRLRNKLNAKENEQEKASIVAELLGYKTVDEMLDAAKDSYIENEISKLTKERVHPTIAKDTVGRKVKEIEDKAAANRKQVTPEKETDDADMAPTGRTYVTEVAELTALHPELRGTQLPAEVVAEFKKGTNLPTAYEMYLHKQTQAELAKLQKENKTLKQNAETARRAPVRGTTHGGATDTKADDPFLAGFGRR